MIYDYILLFIIKNMFNFELMVICVLFTNVLDLIKQFVRCFIYTIYYFNYTYYI